MDVAFKYGRKVALVGRNIVNNTRIARELGYMPVKVENVENNGRETMAIIESLSGDRFRDILTAN